MPSLLRIWGGMVVHVENPDSLFSIGQEQHHSAQEQRHSDQVTKNSVLASKDLFSDPVSEDSNEDLFSDPVPKDSNQDLFSPMCLPSVYPMSPQVTKSPRPSPPYLHATTIKDWRWEQPGNTAGSLVL